MGNQHSAPDKEKEKEKSMERDKERGREMEGEASRATSRHEKHRSRTITPTSLPPAETKVTAEQTDNAPTNATTSVVSNSILSGSKVSQESLPKHPSSTSIATPGSVHATPMKERLVSKTKDIVDAVKKINLKDLSQPTEEEIKKEAETEPTRKFETMKVPSQTSLVDEDELKEADKTGITFPITDRLTVGSEKVPLVLDWNKGAKKVAVAGTFTGWRKRVNLRKTYCPR